MYRGGVTSIVSLHTSICDVFDALANKRIYKPAWAKEDVYAEFEKQLGHQFDPIYCRIFLDHIEEFYAILEEYPEPDIEE